MPLPSISTPKYEMTIPSTGEVVTYRPMLVREEKILYMAQESKEERTIRSALIDVLSSCVENKINMLELASFDIEYMFLQLRAKSVGEVVELEFKHKDTSVCNHATPISIDLEQVGVAGLESFEEKKNLMVDDNLGFQIHYPRIVDLDNVKNEHNQFERLFDLAYACIDACFDAENMYTEFTRDELVEFIERMSGDQFQKFTDYFENLPRLSHTIEYTCEACGKKEKVKVEGLAAFFS